MNKYRLITYSAGKKNLMLEITCSISYSPFLFSPRSGKFCRHQSKKLVKHRANLRSYISIRRRPDFYYSHYLLPSILHRELQNLKLWHSCRTVGMLVSVIFPVYVSATYRFYNFISATSLINQLSDSAELVLISDIHHRILPSRATSKSNIVK